MQIYNWIRIKNENGNTIKDENRMQFFIDDMAKKGIICTAEKIYGSIK